MSQPKRKPKAKREPKTKRKSKRFKSRFVVTVELEVSNRLIKQALSPDWQKDFYKLLDGQQVADHIAYNIARGISVRSLDGFTNMENADVVVHEEEWTEDSED